jgi:hypothetical protein
MSGETKCFFIAANQPAKSRQRRLLMNDEEDQIQSSESRCITHTSNGNQAETETCTINFKTTVNTLFK